MMKPALDTSYPPDLVGASYCGLLELGRMLAGYETSVVLVGGWVPYLLLRDHPASSGEFKHVGSVDIDLAIDPDEVPQSEYASIERRLMERGWTRLDQEGVLFRYHRLIRRGGGLPDQDIIVDFLTVPDPARRKHRHRTVQGQLKASMARGIPLALQHKTTVTIEGELPDDRGTTHVDLSMADVVGCVGMKALVLEERYKEKDAYDVYAVLENYGEGPLEVARIFRPYSREPLLIEALRILGDKFATQRTEGSRAVGAFFTAESGDAHERRCVRAQRTVLAFLRGVEGHPS